MELRVSNTEAAASLDDLLDRVNSKGDTVVIERDGNPVGKLVSARSVNEDAVATMGDLVRLLHAFPHLGDRWADGVEEAVRLGNEPLGPESSWGH